MFFTLLLFLAGVDTKDRRCIILCFVDTLSGMREEAKLPNSHISRGVQENSPPRFHKVKQSVSPIGVQSLKKTLKDLQFLS